jgi:hypothetical protein
MSWLMNEIGERLLGLEKRCGEMPRHRHPLSDGLFRRRQGEGREGGWTSFGGGGDTSEVTR